MQLIESIEEVKRIQLDILSALDEFCTKNGIVYSIIDGTLLGAVRHKGYIPWDDDIDVAMTRPNYDRFIKEFPIQYKEIYELTSIERNKKWDRAYACMYDNRTQLVYKNNSSMATGVLIDIFPVDEVPEDLSDWKKLKKKMKFYCTLSALKSSTSFRISKSIITNIIASISKIMLLPITKRFVAERIDKLARSNNGKGYKFGYVVAFGVGADNRFKISDFNDVVDYMFEDRIFKGLKNSDSVLTDTYGDYMQLPPEEKRVTHHELNAYWK